MRAVASTCLSIQNRSRFDTVDRNRCGNGVLFSFRKGFSGLRIRAGQRGFPLGIRLWLRPVCRSPSAPRHRRGALVGGGGTMQPNATAMVQPSISPDREILQELEQLVGSQTFNQWFRDRAAIEVEAGHVTIAVKNPFLLSWMQHRFRAAVTEAARRAIGESAEVRFQARAADVIKSPCGEVAATASQGPRDAAPPGDSIPRESVRGGSP